MTTLTRARRKAFEEILANWNVIPADIGKRDKFVLSEWHTELAAELAAASLSRSEHKTDETPGSYKVRGIEAAIFGDRPVTQDDLDPTGETEPLKAFESAMHLPDNWQWYPGKGSDEKAWKGLRAFVVKIYLSEGVKAFEEYFTWSIQPYSRGVMTALAIKQNPGNFEASWAAFRAVNPKQEEIKNPQPEPEDDNEYIPNPRA